MPSEWTLNQQVCFPCKWHRTKVSVAGRTHSTYDRYCTHGASGDGELPTMGKGRYIGQSDIRPAWCPIKGNAEAEREAEQDE